ncbi:uncharacterized protein LOC141537265 [Cotesia typhae]|uniref:uncharacterized protein LOC141537265 n=1 Tax=Cotesia typhae TaxID=2053667 RepID=UPI003D698A91
MERIDGDNHEFKTSTSDSCSSKKENFNCSTPLSLKNFSPVEIRLSEIHCSNDIILDTSDSSGSSVPSLPSGLLELVGNEWFNDCVIYDNFSVEIPSSTDLSDDNCGNRNELHQDLSKVGIEKHARLKCSSDITSNEISQRQNPSTIDILFKSCHHVNELREKSLTTHDKVDIRMDYNYSSVNKTELLPLNNSMLDVKNLSIFQSRPGLKKHLTEKKGIISKQYFCPFCKSMVTKFARHLQKDHLDIQTVKKFMKLPLKSKKRAAIIKEIRDKGTLMHNTNKEFNTGSLLTARRSQPGYNRSANDFTSCEYCKGFYSKQSLRIHLWRCEKNHSNKIRINLNRPKRKIPYKQDQ